jgi:hypothetical protein
MIFKVNYSATAIWFFIKENIAAVAPNPGVKNIDD